MNFEARHSKRETKRSKVSDLEARFGCDEHNVLKQSGVPARARRLQGNRLAWLE
jgi:hypothetical protein